MKKRQISFFVLVFMLGSVVFTQKTVKAEPETASQDPSVQSSQSGGDELERTKELLQIWKDHVREVTKERDDALAEIEKVKSAGSTAQPITEIPTTGAAPAAPNAELESANQTIANLTRSLENLKAENSSLQRNNGKIKAEVSKLQAEATAPPAAPVISTAPAGPSQGELDAAKGEANQLRSQIASLKQDNDGLTTQFSKIQDELKAARADDRSALLDSKLKESEAVKDATARENEKLNAQLTELLSKTFSLQKEHEALKNSMQQSEQNAGELKEAKSQAIRLTDENKAVAAERDRLRSENEHMVKESSAHDTRLSDLEKENMALRSQNAAVEAQTKQETEALRSQIAELKTQVQKNLEAIASAGAARADTERGHVQDAKKFKDELAARQADTEVAKQAYAELEKTWRDHDKDTEAKLQPLRADNEALKSQVDKLTADKGGLEQYTRELKDSQSHLQRQIDELEVKFSTVNLDVEGLRTNVNTSIDSLAKKYTQKKN